MYHLKYYKLFRNPPPAVEWRPATDGLGRITIWI